MTKPNEKQVERAEEVVKTLDNIHVEHEEYCDLCRMRDLSKKGLANNIAQAIAVAVAEERANITQEVKKATEPFVEALEKLLEIEELEIDDWSVRSLCKTTLKAHKEKYSE